MINIRGENMEKELFDILPERKREVLLHYEKTLLSPLSEAEYVFSDDDDVDVDIVIMAPGEDFPYYTISTVGLSNYKFNTELARNELTIVMPENYSTNLDKKENAWPVMLLREIIYGAVVNHIHFELNKIYLSSFKSDELDCIGGIVVIPELMNMDFIDEKIDYDYTRFFLFVPLSEEQIDKAEDVGIKRFIEFDLHDINGPDMVAKYTPPQVNSKLQKMIEHNERNLKK